MALTIADIERWDAGDVREVFHAASSRAQAVQDASNGLAALPAFTTWGGEAAEAAREAIGKTRAALSTEIDTVSGRVVAGPGFGGNPMELLIKQEQLQPRVDRLIAEANLVDMALANAIEMAGGTTPVPESSRANYPNIGDRPTAPAGGEADIGDGDDRPKPDIQLPSAGESPVGAGRPAGARPSPATLEELMGQPVPIPRPIPLNPRAVDEFKSVARERDGVPAQRCALELTVPSVTVASPSNGGGGAVNIAPGETPRLYAVERRTFKRSSTNSMRAMLSSRVNAALTTSGITRWTSWSRHRRRRQRLPRDQGWRGIRVLVEFLELGGTTCINASAHQDVMMLVWLMRTTIDIPDDLHRHAQAIARDTHRTMSETVVDLMRRGLGTGASTDISTDSRTGLPVVSVGTIVTSDDVRSLEDDE